MTIERLAERDPHRGKSFPGFTTVRHYFTLYIIFHILILEHGCSLMSLSRTAFWNTCVPALPDFGLDPLEPDEALTQKSPSSIESRVGNWPPGTLIVAFSVADGPRPRMHGAAATDPLAALTSS